MARKKSKASDIKHPDINPTTKVEDTIISVAPTTTTIPYTGTVTIKYQDRKTGKISSVQHHNTGESGLFKFIAHVIGKDPYYKNYAPWKLMAYNKTGTTYNSLLNQPISMISSPTYIKPAGSDIENGVQLVFNIPATAFKNINTPINALVLAAYKWKGPQGEQERPINDDICAEISTDILPSAGTNILIYWTLAFTNANVPTVQS